MFPAFIAQNRIHCYDFLSSSLIKSKIVSWGSIRGVQNIQYSRQFFLTYLLSPVCFHPSIHEFPKKYPPNPLICPECPLSLWFLRKYPKYHNAASFVFRVFCNERYLLPTCEEYCVHTNNDQGHYDCDYANGKKVCIDGWYGPKCLQKRKDCTPRNNVIGHYRCDPITGDIICLSGWRDEKSNCTKGNECL